MFSTYVGSWGHLGAKMAPKTSIGKYSLSPLGNTPADLLLSTCTPLYVAFGNVFVRFLVFVVLVALAASVVVLAVLRES